MKSCLLLLSLTRKECLIEYGAITKGVSSIIEKEFDAAIGHSHSTNQPGGLSQGGETILSRV
jgi:hypothetical protein